MCSIFLEATVSHHYLQVIERGCLLVLISVIPTVVLRTAAWPSPEQRGIQTPRPQWDILNQKSTVFYRLSLRFAWKVCEALISCRLGVFSLRRSLRISGDLSRFWCTVSWKTRAEAFGISSGNYSSWRATGGSLRGHLRGHAKGGDGSGLP